MADLKSLCNKFKLDTNLSFDIRYADDTTIMFIVQLQLSTVELQVAYTKWGMKIFSKCKVITSSEKRITLESFCFLGSIVLSTKRDVGRRIVLALAAFGRLRNGIFSSINISARQIIWTLAYTANSNLWCGGFNTRITGDSIS